MRVFPIGLSCLAFVVSGVFGDGPKDNVALDVRPIPPVGIEVPAEERAALEKGLAELKALMLAAEKAQVKHPRLADLMPDLEVYWKAVDWALRYQEVHKPAELKAAHELLAEGKERAVQFQQGKTPWLQQKGLVVRGYRSKIDESVQPYGMVIPESYTGAPRRLDTWFHGRGETLSELSFMDQRRKQVGQVAPKDALVIHLYGRYSCANKFAGEIDLLEALEHAGKFYNVDADRVIVRGFSMGGAATWQFGVHYADRWCAVSPGAGFSETPEFLKVFQKEDVSSAPWYEQKLWRWYNATDSALNLFHSPTVAYSGEFDRQKQAADVMEAALRAENLDMVHLIGPKTEHKMHPDSLVEIEKRLAEIAAAGRARMPFEVHFATWFLRYNRMHWVVVDGVEAQWERTRVHAQLTGGSEVTVRTQNVTALTLDMAAGHCPLHPMARPLVKIDGQELTVRRPKSDRSWTVHLRKSGEGKWQEALSANEGQGDKLVKRHGLQGPIDDAFLDRFIMVTPSGAAWNEKGGAWAVKEAERARFEWRRQFRGDAMVRVDSALTEADIASSNLVLWGDPGSNSVLAKVLEKLPIRWTKEELVVNGKKYPAAGHMPILVFPNPLNPARYVVLNSGFTYREYAYLNNARQVPMLPDWAVVDLSEAPGPVRPGKIADAGFFDEVWGWKAAE
jgi:pimeloyl-ACP methyl ester carboxylesterase